MQANHHRLQRCVCCALLLCLAGCQAMPPKDIRVTPASSILGVDVVFPVPGPDLRLGGVFFLKERSGGGLNGVDHVIPASWINGSRAYLLNPDPGIYYVAAAGYVVNLPVTSTSTSLGGGVTATLSTGGSVGHVVVFPEDMIRETRTTIGPGRLEFAGAFRIKQGGRINAKTQFQGDLQREVAELIRPGVTSASGLSGYMTMTWMVKEEESSLADAAIERTPFLHNAAKDFEKSAFSRLVPPAEPVIQD